MNKFVIFLICLPFAVQLYAYESTLLNLATPVELDSRQYEFSLQHRFYTPVEEQDQFYLTMEAWF